MRPNYSYSSKQSKRKKSDASNIRKIGSSGSSGLLGSSLSSSGVDLEAIDQLKRINTCMRTNDGKGGWKVLPKDSWELYKRRKRPYEKDDNPKIPKADNKRPRRRIAKRRKKNQSRKVTKRPRNYRMFNTSRKKDIGNRAQDQKRANNQASSNFIEAYYSTKRPRRLSNVTSLNSLTSGTDNSEI